jgi:hypothetical protein
MRNLLLILIALLIGVDTIFINFRFAGISYDRLLEFLLFFILFKAYLDYLIKDTFFRIWNYIIVLLALLQLSSNIRLVINNESEFDIIYIELVKCFSYIVFSFLFYYLLKNKPQYINIIVGLHVLTVVFGFLLHPFSPFALEMIEVKNVLFSSLDPTKYSSKISTEEAYIAGGYLERLRLSGPFLSSIRFSYFAYSSFALSFYLYIKSNKRVYIITLLLIFLASVLSQTRSLLLAELVLTFGYIFFNPSIKAPLYKIGLVSTMVVLTGLLYFGKDIFLPDNVRVTKISSQGQSDSRPLLWLTGIEAVIYNPFGVSASEYSEIKQVAYYQYGHRDILHLSSHNGPINVGFHYTILGYMVIFYLILFLLKYINKMQDKFGVFFKLILVGYLIHTFFHNDFIFNSDYLILTIMMLIGHEGSYGLNNLGASKNYLLET